MEHGRLAEAGMARVVARAGSDVCLLTEVNESVELPGFRRHLGAACMAANRRWAGIYSRLPLTPLPVPHVASAAAEIEA